MDIFYNPKEMQDWSRRQAILGKTICLVPTMGYFHEGHLSLMRKGKSLADLVVVSHFVNPTQFGPNEDLGRYPRDFKRDIYLAEQQKVDAIFAPTPEQMYPAGFLTEVSVGEITARLCGKSRPGHFAGVTTVVAKLFNIVHPDVAVFGQKDFQQLAVIRRMVRDLNFSIKIVGHPIIREKDGLAMSSRNVYLGEDNRASALSLASGLQLAQQRARQGERAVTNLQTMLQDHFSVYPAATVDYISFVHDETLEPMEIVDEHTVLALAVHIGGKVRLIDNAYVLPAEETDCLREQPLAE